jgi:hypothetical protein
LLVALPNPNIHATMNLMPRRPDYRRTLRKLAVHTLSLFAAYSCLIFLSPDTATAASANDMFANGTVITQGEGVILLTGSNTGATREGEGVSS